MKNVLFLILLIFLYSCTNNKSVYWCGDHACINKKEKEAYFKKTMIIEKKIISKENKKDLTNSEKIIKEAKLKEKKRIANEKKIKKEYKLEQKRLKKDKKLKAKKAKLEEKRLKKENIEIEKKNAKKILSKKEKIELKKLDNSSSYTSKIKNVEFEQLKDQIIKRNLIRSYPDINDIPNL
tara:strand:- start:456 stop:995 length:540 start_codon:yes stop_codon:yes gene_type:complete